MQFPILSMLRIVKTQQAPDAELRIGTLVESVLGGRAVDVGLVKV
jgi:hypothetical protein